MYYDNEYETITVGDGWVQSKCDPWELEPVTKSEVIMDNKENKRFN